MLVNKGFSIIEVLVSIVIISVIALGVLSLNYYHKINLVKNEELVSRELIIQNIYDLFNEDPNNFKTNIVTLYEGTWIEGDYHFKEELKIPYTLRFSYDMFGANLQLFEGGDEIEKWHRYAY